MVLFLGDDAMNVQWMDLSGSLDLYASHIDFLAEVAKNHNASWWCSTAEQLWSKIIHQIVQHDLIV